MRFKTSLIILLFIFLSYNTVNTAFGQAINIVRNFDFEEHQESGFDSWQTGAWNDRPGMADFLPDKDIFYSGRQSARLTSNFATDARFKQKIAVEADSYYRLSCQIKTENIPSENKGANLSIEGLLDTTADITGTNDWQYVELYGKTDKEQEEIVLTLGLGGYGSLNTGTAWFDDVRVEKLEALPEGVNAINLFKSETQPKKDETKPSPAVIILPSLFLLSLALGIIYASSSIFNRKNSEFKSNAGGVNKANQKQSKLGFLIDKKDIIIMSVLTGVYLIPALFNLGSLKVPETYWKPSKSGESVIMDFGRHIQLSRIFYYNGLGDGKFKVEYEDPSGSFLPLSNIEVDDLFTWKYVEAQVNTNRIKLITDVPGAMINEIGIYQNGKDTPVNIISISDASEAAGPSKGIENLLDEQNTIPSRPSFMTDTYFDEIYHARTAYEHIHKIHPYEWTHPPLGKVIISIGILIFGMNPFGWRIMGTLFGAAMIPLMYLFGKKLFGNRFFAFCTAFLMTVDFMHFAQTRIATIDVYGTFFIILMYYFMFDYFMNKSYQVGFKKSLKPLFLSGLFFGIGSASKWIAIYGGAGLAVLFFTAKILEYIDYRKAIREYTITQKEKPAWTNNFIKYNIIGTCLYCVLFFVVIPLLIYFISYIPHMIVPGAQSPVKLVIDLQKQMFSYHNDLVDTHPFSSPWYEWPIIFKPIWYYTGGDLPSGKVSTIGILAVGMSAITVVKKRDKAMLVVFTGLFFQFFPWTLISRLTFIYHYFASVPFVIMAIVYMLKNLSEDIAGFNKYIYIYLGLTALLFVIFYPALSGLIIDKWYIDGLKWFPSWIF